MDIQLAHIPLKNGTAGGEEKALLLKEETRACFKSEKSICSCDGYCMCCCLGLTQQLGYIAHHEKIYIPHGLLLLLSEARRVCVEGKKCGGELVGMRVICTKEIGDRCCWHQAGEEGGILAPLCVSGEEAEATKGGALQQSKYRVRALFF